MFCTWLSSYTSCMCAAWKDKSWAHWWWVTLHLARPSETCDALRWCLNKSRQTHSSHLCVDKLLCMQFSENILFTHKEFWGAQLLIHCFIHIWPDARLLLIIILLSVFSLLFSKKCSTSVLPMTLWRYKGCPSESFQSPIRCSSMGA